MNIRELTLDDLRQKIEGAICYITSELLPQVRTLGLTDLPDFDKMNFPNGTARACVESLTRLAKLATDYKHMIETNTVVLDDLEWGMLGQALRALDMHPEIPN